MTSDAGSTGASAVDDDPQLREFMHKMYALEEDGCPRARIEVGPFTALVVSSALQVAMRHPGSNPAYRKFITGFMDQLSAVFAGTLGEVIIRRGATVPISDPGGSAGPDRQGGDDGGEPQGRTEG